MLAAGATRDLLEHSTPDNREVDAGALEHL
jgi:hypothetical protein